MGRAGDLAVLADRARPIAAARERVLPVSPALAGLLPDGGLRRGSAVAVAGSTSLALAVAAGPSAAGSWVAAVGARHLGLVAAAELGVALERFALVPDPGRERWAAVVAALLDAVDVVLAWPVGRVRAADARRLVARARERGSVLVACGPGRSSWVEGADVRLTAAGIEWAGLGHGHGHLVEQRLDVVVDGRGRAARPRRVPVVLTGAVPVPSPPVVDAPLPRAAAG